MDTPQDSSSRRFSFDGSAIHCGANESWLPCEHLRPFLAASLLKGAAIEAVDSGWSEVAFVVNLDAGFRPEVIKKAVEQTQLEFGANNDPHYPIHYELVCNQCKQGLSWPQSNAHISAI